MHATTPSAYEALMRDARAVYDAVSLRFDDYEPHGRPTWIVATLVPGPRNGFETIPGSHLDGATGELHTPVGATSCVIEEGTWNALAASPPGAPSTSRSYFWYQPHQISVGSIPPDRLFWPLGGAGTILFRPVPGKTDGEYFSHARQIFPGWLASVAPAFAFHEANPTLLDLGPRTVATAQLVKLVSQGNPILAAMAFRDLLSLGLAPPDYIRAQLSRVSGPLGAVFGYLTITLVGPNVARPFARETLQVVDSVGEPTLRALALGAFAASVFSDWGAPFERAKPVLEKIRRRLSTAGVAVDADPQFAWIFERTGV